MADRVSTLVGRDHQAKGGADSTIALMRSVTSTYPKMQRT